MEPAGASLASPSHGRFSGLHAESAAALRPSSLSKAPAMDANLRPHGDGSLVRRSLHIYLLDFCPPLDSKEA